MPRASPRPASLAFCTSDHYDRAAHTYGKSYPELARGLARDYASAPDVVAYPRNEAEIAAVLDWAGGADATVTPFGGGSSVCGGVEPKRNGHKGAVTIDLREMGKVKEVDKTSRAALIEGGTYGPALEAQLRPHGLTLRHFPQSFEYSTLGGWIATRGGGHFATLYTHIDDLVESLRTVTPKGMLESRRLPGSGAGPSPDRMMIGSEGILGIITQAWMRLQDRPTFRAGGAVRFKDFFAAARAVRAISQAGLYPSNCRILDPAEAYNTGAADGSVAIMVLAFESADHDVEPWMKRALECCADHGGTPEASGRGRASRRRGRRVAQRLHPHALRDGAADRARRHQRYVRDLDHLGSLRAIPRRDQEPRPRTPSCRRPAARARSPAASRMSIPTARRPTSRSMRWASRASSASSGPRSRAPRSMP